MPHKMNDADRCDAAAALMQWFHSQDINPREAVTILTLSLVELMAELCEVRGVNVKDSGRKLADIIAEALNLCEPGDRP